MMKKKRPFADGKGQHAFRMNRDSWIADCPTRASLCVALGCAINRTRLRLLSRAHMRPALGMKILHNS